MNMTEHIDKIDLFAGNHAIEVVNFVVNLLIPIDQADVRRFDEKDEELRKLFPAINSPEGVQIEFGGPVLRQSRSPVPVKELTFFSSDGKPEWVGWFGESRIVVSCRKYTKWEKVWPDVKLRLDELLRCIDPYKPVYSVDYSITDTFSAKSDKALIARNIFKPNKFIADHILKLPDPRWDFSQGWFDNPHDSDQILVRVDSRSGIENKRVVASIDNLHSQRFKNNISVKDLISANDRKQYKIDHIFDKFHDKNKDLLKTLLADKLLSRMGLKE